MIKRFDHAVIAARQLDDARRVFEQDLGLQVYAGGRHTGLGTENAIIRFGLDYLELLGIFNADEVAAAGVKRASLLDFLATHEGGMLGYCLATDDLDGLAARLKSTGLEALGPYPMQRLRPDGVLLEWRLLVPGGTAWRRPWPFFIEWGMADGARLGFEQPGNHALGADRVVGVSVVVSDIEAAQYLYGHQLDLASASSTQGVAGESASYAVGDFRIDLVQPTPESRAGRFMAVYGEGLHQVYLRVASLAGAKAHLAEQGVHCVAAEGIDGALAVPASRALGAELILCEA